MNKPYTPELPEDERLLVTLRPTLKAFAIPHGIMLVFAMTFGCWLYLPQGLLQAILAGMAVFVILFAFTAWLKGSGEIEFSWLMNQRNRWYVTPFRILIGTPYVEHVIDMEDIDYIAVRFWWSMTLYCKDGTKHRLDYVWKPRQTRAWILSIHRQMKSTI